MSSNVDTTSEEANHKPKAAWFTEDVTEIPPSARELLEQYSNIAPDEVLPHVIEQVSHTACSNIWGNLTS